MPRARNTGKRLIKPRGTKREVCPTCGKGGSGKRIKSTSKTRRRR